MKSNSLIDLYEGYVTVNENKHIDSVEIEVSMGHFVNNDYNGYALMFSVDKDNRIDKLLNIERITMDDKTPYAIGCYGCRVEISTHNDDNDFIELWFDDEFDRDDIIDIIASHRKVEGVDYI